MGGHGSGRPGIRCAVEDALRIDLASPAVRSALAHGSRAHGTLAWRVDGEQVARVGYAFEMADPSNARMLLNFSIDGRPVRQTIELAHTRPRFGGIRWWFVCPVLQQRGLWQPVRTLFLPARASAFASRVAHGLNYRSQKESRSLPKRIERLLREYA